MCVFLFIPSDINNLWFLTQASWVIFRCNLMNSDITVAMWVKWMKWKLPTLSAVRRDENELLQHEGLNWWGQFPHFSHTPVYFFFFYSKWTNQIRSQEERRSTQTSAHLSSPPLPPHKSLVILPALDVWDTDVASLHCRPRSIVVSCACGKRLFPLGPRN